jgi:uncharacterized protein (TIGR02300 family)
VNTASENPQGLLNVAKAELGTKRLCGSCSTKFYDLNKDPIVCPKCGTVFVVATTAARPRPEAAAAARAAALVPEAEPAEPAEAEFVSLEEADAEAQGKTGADAGAAAGTEDDIEIDEGLDDAAFIAEEEEDNTDVTGIIGDVENEEET